MNFEEKLKKRFEKTFKGTVLWKEHWSFISQSLSDCKKELGEESDFKLRTVLNNLSDNDGKLTCFDRDILSLLQKDKENK